jgi:porin
LTRHFPFGLSLEPIQARNSPHLNRPVPHVYEWVGNVSLQGQGIFPCRPQDTMGVGYFSSGLSGSFEALLSPVIPVDELQGVELFCNAAVTPWFHLTADLQVVQPAVVAADTAIVFGLRAKVEI